ncbi:hypothetical protein BUE80_DR002842 [Diplocarpon rosae]|nr:hypothetical protein BUE80_DR002842 [Diplocarpon rosae]
MPPISDLLAQISGKPSEAQSTYTIPPTTKRKSDEQVRTSINKMQRIEAPSANSSRPIAQISKPSTMDASMAKMKLGKNGQSRPVARPSTSTTTFQNGQPTPPPSNDATKSAPKKGSFAEIMARGKAAQSTLGQVGKIQHKRIEKMPSKREREDLKAQKSSNLQKNLAPNSKFSKMGQATVRNSPSAKDNGKIGQNGAKLGGKGQAAPEPEKKIKKAATATTGYTGTSRPKPAGAASKTSASASSRYNRGPDRDRYRGERYGARYAYPSEEEEEDDEEEEEHGYESDLSDMEAAAFEVDEEEEEATRIARREDAEALAEENRLKREKEEKRRRLTAMAKAKSRR